MQKYRSMDVAAMGDDAGRATFDRIAYWQAARSRPKRFPHNEQAHSPQYLTFEIDSGGFNNIRQAFEYAVVVAAITGRVLVLPPPRRWYLINYGPLTREGEPGGVSRIEDFFDVSDLSRYVSIITAPEWAARERTRFDIPDEFFKGEVNNGSIEHQVEVSGRWDRWLRENAHPILWNPLSNVIFHPDIQSVLDGPCAPTARFIDGRVAVEMDDMLRQAPILHLPCANDRGFRQLGQVSSMVAFDNTEGPDLIRQLLRNGVHYVPRVFEIAASLINRLGLFEYSAIHIRRNDFQYKEVKVTSTEIAKNIAPILRDGEPLYVATDETSAEFLSGLRREGKIVTWADLVAATPGVHAPAWLVACIEQVICAGARVFVGTQFSTMSSYVVRLRGFIDAPDAATYYHTESLRDPILSDHTIRPVSGQEYMREDETLWRDHRSGYGPKYALICTDTHPSVQWQCELLEHTWRAVRQPGELVRLVATNSDNALPEHRWIRVVRTRFSNVHPDTGDEYPPYNRLYSFQQWITEYDPHGSILILDPDYIFRSPVTESVGEGEMPLAQTWIDCGLWSEKSRFVETMREFSSARREDLQRVTWPALIHSSDFKRLVPRWIELTAHFREHTGAWESDMVAFVVASAELGIRYKPSNFAAWMNWPEELVKGAPIVHYCQKVQDTDGKTLWWKRDYRPWQQLNVMPQQAKLDYCRDLLAVVKRYAAWRRAGESVARTEPDILELRVYLKNRQPLQLYCQPGSQALTVLFEAMEEDDGNQTLFLEIDSEQRIEFTQSDLIAIETGVANDEDSARHHDDEFLRVVVQVSGMPEFSLFSEPDSPAVQVLRSAVAANASGAEDEVMYLQTDDTQRIYFLRSCLQSVRVAPEPE